MSLLIHERRLSQLKLIVLLGITLVAAFYRLYRIDTIPPGNRYDPAYYGVDALEILEGERPIFLSTNFGREALFSYLVALCVAALGPISYSMYLTSAIVGVLTVPAVFLVAEELFAEEEGALGQFGGLAAALTTAISYWHLNWSRFGVRAVLLPLFASLTVYFLWRGLRTGLKRHFVVSGFILGLGMYTYQAARILPLLVVLGFGCVIVSRRGLTRRDVVNLAIVTLVALLVFAPLGIYFATHPGSFSSRIEQASILDASQGLAVNLRALGDGFIDTLLNLGFYGDQEPTTNLPGRPSLNGFLFVLFSLGVFISLLRIKRPTYLFLLAWLAVMSIPAIISQYGPIAKRAIGTFPAIMTVIAIGAVAPWDAPNRWAARRRSRDNRVLKVLWMIVMAAGFVYSAALTYHDYFVVWAGDPDLFTHFEVGPTAIGQYVRTLPSTENVYLSPLSPAHPSIVYNSQQRAGIKGYDGRHCLVVPEQTMRNTTYVIVPGEDANSLGLLHAYFPQGEIAYEGAIHYQQPYFVAYRVPEGNRALVAPLHPAAANWENKIRLLGYDLNADAFKPGDTIHLTLYLEALEEMERGYTVFAHLLGPHNPATGGPLWGQHDSEPCQRAYPTSVWTVGEIVRDQFAIVIPADAPPGEYQLQTGLYLLATMTRLSVTDVLGTPLSNDAVPLGVIQVQGDGE